MKIGGLQPVTLLDYPGKLAASIFTQGCNMRCPFCHNPNLVLPDLINEAELFPESKIFDFLRERRKYLDGVCITGGEPTVQPDIVEFCQKIKDLDYQIKIDVNGILSKVISRLIDRKLIDYIAMDIKASPEKYNQASGVKININNILESIDIIKKSGIDHEFRSTLVKGIHKKTDVEEMAKMIKGANKYFLQNFTRQNNTVNPNFKSRSFTKMKMNRFAKIAGKYVKECIVR